MSRVIKFRAWCLDNKWMEECFYLQAHNGVIFDTPSKTYDTPNIEIEENPNLVVMQFTGLTDYENIDLYEDDIVCVEGSGNCVVKMCPYYGVVFVNGDGYEQPVVDCLSEQDQYRRVGNIHQNSDLLK